MGCTILAYVIASAIPVFGGLVNLIGATFGTFICIVPFVCRILSSLADLYGKADSQGVFWLWDNWNPPVRTMRWYLMAAWSTFVVICGLFFMGAGVSGSYTKGAVSRSVLTCRLMALLSILEIHTANQAVRPRGPVRTTRIRHKDTYHTNRAGMMQI